MKRKMFSITSRLNFVCTHASSILITITFCLSISPLLLQPPNVNVNINASNETVIKNLHYAIVKFDLQTNLTSIYNWNVKDLWVSFDY